MNKELTQELVREFFEYNPETGILRHKIARGNVRIGDEAGCVLSTGYLQTAIYGKRYLAHRIAFLHYHGFLPEVLDHIDNVKSNNAIINIREASYRENSFNKKTGSNNTSGVKGVFWDKSKWRASIRVNGKKEYFGSFENIEDAKKAVEEARIKFHGEFANHG